MNAEHPVALTRWIVRLQAVSAALAGLVCGAFLGQAAGIAALIGGGIGVALTIYAAVRSFSVPGDADPQRIVQALYRAEAMKLILAILIFGLAAYFYPDRFLPLMLGYIATLPAYRFALLKAPGAGRNPDS